MQSKTEETLKKKNATLRKELAVKNRELEIEAALEKVRSRSLAMHHSSELEQVAGALFDQLVDLGLSLDGALIFIFDKEKRSITHWVATTQLSAPVRIDLPYDKAIENNTIIKDLWNAIRTGEHIINRTYSGEVKNDYFRYIAKCNESKIPESVRQFTIERENWTVHFAAEKNSLIGFDNWSGHVTKEEDFTILIRFGKVFEQAYTRFLDLQKAEAQAREAQIEAALEKVRSRSLAMHHSNELSEVVTVVFERLKELSFLVNEGAAIILTFIENSKDHIEWITDPMQSYSTSFKIPYSHHSVSSDFMSAKENGAAFFSKLYTSEEKNDYFNYLFQNTDYSNLPAEVKKLILESKSYGISVAFEKNSAILIPSNTGKLLSDNEKEILKRDSKPIKLRE